MKKFVAKTLDLALLNASKYYDCSITQLDYEIVQSSSNGILGLFLKKDAIIVVSKKADSKQNRQNTELSTQEKEVAHNMESTLDSNPATNNDSNPHSLTSPVGMSSFDRVCDPSDSLGRATKVETEGDYKLGLQDLGREDSKSSGRDSKYSLGFRTQKIESKESNVTQDSKDFTQPRQPQVFKESIPMTPTQDIHNQKDYKDLYLDIEDSNFYDDENLSDFRQSLRDNRNMQKIYSKYNKIDFDENMDEDSQNSQKAYFQIDSQKSNKKYYQKDYENQENKSKDPKNERIKNIDEICIEVQIELRELLDFLPLSLSKISVKPYDENTLFIFIDGLDAALLIGQKGYRYKSLSYLLFSWINVKYGYGVRLEISHFLRNQEENIHEYLEPIIQEARTQGYSQTKPLDGILIHIALKALRDALPDKYVAIKVNSDGEKYIVINEFSGSFKNTRGDIYGFDIPKY